MDEFLDLTANDVYRVRHEQVAAHIITNEKLNHSVTISAADLDSLPEALKGDATSSDFNDGQSIRYFRVDKGLVRVAFNMGRRLALVRGFFLDEQSAQLFSKTVKRFTRPATLPDEKVALSFWTWDGDSAGRSNRRIEVPSWKEISGNYTTSVGERIAEVMAVKPTGNLSGKLILWRGAPGTGKTWTLRSLCREWRKWCSAHYIVDPDVFFSRAAYMTEVLMALPNEAEVVDDESGADGKADEPVTKKVPRWNLLILEDCGELVGVDSKTRTGQSLSKLLNLSDGLLGQGINLMVLITTNEDYEALHPAISRQGRCLSNLSFESFSEAEAEKWLHNHGSNERPLKGKRTLADLYAHVTERETIQNNAERRSAGFTH